MQTLCFVNLKVLEDCSLGSCNFEPIYVQIVGKNAIYISHAEGITSERPHHSDTVAPTWLKRSELPFDNCFQITNTSGISATAFV